MGLNIKITQETRFWALHYDILEALETNKEIKTNNKERQLALLFFTKYLKNYDNRQIKPSLLQSQSRTWSK